MSRSAALSTARDARRKRCSRLWGRNLFPPTSCRCRVFVYALPVASSGAPVICPLPPVSFAISLSHEFCPQFDYRRKHFRRIIRHVVQLLNGVKNRSNSFLPFAHRLHTRIFFFEYLTDQFTDSDAGFGALEGQFEDFIGDKHSIFPSSVFSGGVRYKQWRQTCDILIASSGARFVPRRVQFHLCCRRFRSISRQSLHLATPRLPLGNISAESPCTPPAMLTKTFLNRAIAFGRIKVPYRKPNA